MRAARGGSIRIVKLCLRQGMDINAFNRQGLTAVHLCQASYFGQEEILEYLLSKGALATGIDFTGGSALTEAARLGHVECVEKLVECEVDVDHTDHDGCSALQIAAAMVGESCKILLEAGARPDISDNTGFTLLHDAAVRGKAHVIGLVTQYSTRLNSVNSDGHTALHLAVFGDRAECIRLLLLAGADSNVQDNNGRTVLHYAAAAGKEDVVQLICDGDTSVNLVDEDEDTALHIACYYGHNGIVKKLLGFGANPDARNDNGSLPMHLAAMMGHADA